MRFPKITSLYGRIFAIFWFTMLVVLIAVLALPHLDPRVARELQGEQLDRLYQLRDNLEQRYDASHDVQQVLQGLKHNNRRRANSPKDSDLPRLFLTDAEGNILQTQNNHDFKTKALKNFITTVESPDKPMQRLYGRYMLVGPVPIELAKQNMHLYVGIKWNQPPPFLLRMFDKPLQLLLVVMLVSTPFLLWLAWALSQPARRLERAAKRVAKGEFTADPSLEKGTSEFRQAGASFNQMVKAVNQMLSGQQRLLSDISHELRSPLTRLRMATALATRKQGTSSELERIDTEAQRLEQMINELLELSRMSINSHANREIQPATSLWEEVLKDAQFEAEQLNKVLHYSQVPAALIPGSPQLLMSAVENIVRNAVHYSDKQINVSMNSHQTQFHIIVEDDGPGVPDTELNDIFRPFYRVSTARDRDSGGTGLGLAITQSAILQHSGTIVASRSALGGLKMSISLPLTND